MVEMSFGEGYPLQLRLNGLEKEEEDDADETPGQSRGQYCVSVSSQIALPQTGDVDRVDERIGKIERLIELNPRDDTVEVGVEEFIGATFTQ